jgi:alanyl-tRNA synthetase
VAEEGAVQEEAVHAFSKSMDWAASFSKKGPEMFFSEKGPMRSCRVVSMTINTTSGCGGASSAAQAEITESKLREISRWLLLALMSDQGSKAKLG